MKILMYSHDSYGLGHLRRTLALAEAFVERDPQTSVLILTGSTVSGAYRMKKGIDLLKLPSAVKVGSGVYEPDRMSVSFEALRELRTGLIQTAAESFDPDVFVVDKAPLGMKGEVVPTLEFLKAERPETLTVLGLRDVMDDPYLVRKSWEEKDVHTVIEELYDMVLVYGPREVYDPLPEYGLSQEILDRTRYVGYIGKTEEPGTAADLPFEPGYALVTAGGGGDGFELIKTYLEGLREWEPSFDSIVVTGPLMADEDKKTLEHLARGLRVHISEFRTDMAALVYGAGAVVAMGGYNTTTELLAARKPAVIVPRVEPRVEQLIRARRLSALGLIDMIHPDDLAPATLRGKVEKLMKSGDTPRVRVRVDLSGASKAVEFVRSGLFEKRSVPERSLPEAIGA
jgi:predicted glycosyltransferase